MDLVYLFARWPEWARSQDYKYKRKRKEKTTPSEGSKRISNTLYQLYKASFYLLQRVSLAISLQIQAIFVIEEDLYNPITSEFNTYRFILK